jgi:ATP-dependent RNA helicase RhlE
VARRNTASELVTQSVHLCPQKVKRELLAFLIKKHQWFQVLVFTRTKHGANKLAEYLGKHDIPSAAIHGNKSQSARTRALADFKDAKLQVLVATDIAARGLDIDQLPQVVNFELPNVSEDYVHRIGRTGRAGSSGAAVSLVDREELPLLKDIERLMKRLIDKVEVPDFVPSAAPPTPTSARPANPAAPTTAAAPAGPGAGQGQGQKQGQGRASARAASPRARAPARVRTRGKGRPARAEGSQASRRPARLQQPSQGPSPSAPPARPTASRTTISATGWTTSPAPAPTTATRKPALAVIAMATAAASTSPTGASVAASRPAGAAERRPGPGGPKGGNPNRGTPAALDEAKRPVVTLTGRKPGDVKPAALFTPG